VGCYVGLQPGRRNSGQSEPQLGRRPLSAHVAGARGASHSGSVWSRHRPTALGFETGRAGWEERQEASGDCNSAKVSRLAASAVGERRSLPTAAQSQSESTAGSGIVQICRETWPNFHPGDGKRGRQTGGSTGGSENTQLAPSETKSLNEECGWKGSDRGDWAGEKPCPTKKQKNPLDSDRPSHEGDSAF
jgi:hypothetical protein